MSDGARGICCPLHELAADVPAGWLACPVAARNEPPPAGGLACQRVSQPETQSSKHKKMKSPTAVATVGLRVRQGENLDEF